MNYHAHVYFKASELQKAEEFFAQARAMAMGSAVLQVHKVFSKIVGPHALPMVELRFSDETKKEAIAWIDAHRKEWSVLIHQDSGNDVRDHSENVTWLGETLPIHFEFFKLIESSPDLLVHQL